MRGGGGGEGSRGVMSRRPCKQSVARKALLQSPQFSKIAVEGKGSSSKTPVAKPDGTKMFCSAFLNDARMCCFFANTIVKY